MNVVRFRTLPLLPALVLGVAFMTASPIVAAKSAHRCLFISSYHRGYEWSDGVERGLRSAIGDRCVLRQFDMDTKRHKGEEYLRHIGLEAKSLIESWHPDVVITADDNAAKYVIQPYFKDSTIPFVFCGVNWTADEYGFPYSNVTGMVEVAPIKPMLRRAATIAGGSRGFYLGAKTLTESKNLARFKNSASELGMHMDGLLASTLADWLSAFKAAQRYDFIVLGSNSGINDWDAERASAEVRQASRKLTATNHGWMMPFAMLGMTKVPEEQGEWSGKSALAILEGVSPKDIPIVVNQRWDIWINQRLLSNAGIELPRDLQRKAKRVAAQH